MGVGVDGAQSVVSCFLGMAWGGAAEEPEEFHARHRRAEYPRGLRPGAEMGTQE